MQFGFLGDLVIDIGLNVAKDQNEHESDAAVDDDGDDVEFPRELPVVV